MEPLVFLSAVLPSVGKLCVAVIDDTAKVQFFVDSHEELQRTTELQDMVGRTTYMALASFDDAKSRKAEHALYIRSLFLDLRDISTCVVCGGTAVAKKCKIICQNCGYTRDCSDP